ncbi:FAD-dependent oxidoreductase [Paenibacillus sp. SGZ-1009]|uniref:FAD-dependent oxidoreductase n=1 Tax=Paenibacillus campi TaxID=3106031 RepID=UPI002AFEE9D1|nr:FAD-dependent oxidoreductase [Paenibacillus sp. SGZ-1009]
MSFRSSSLDSLPNAAQASVCDVLIVGAGPTGLTLALELARRGIAIRIIDQAAGPSRYSKALGVMARTLELLEPSVAAQMVEQGLPIRQAAIYSGNRRIANIPFGERIPSRYPYILMLPQNETEHILLERLSQLGVQVEYGRALVDMENYTAQPAEIAEAQAATASAAPIVVLPPHLRRTGSSGSSAAAPAGSASSRMLRMTATVETVGIAETETIAVTAAQADQTIKTDVAPTPSPSVVKTATTTANAHQETEQPSSTSTPNTERIHAGWMIGCDGAHSKVRHLLGMAFPGTSIMQQFALADVRIEGEIEHDRLHVHLHQGQIAAFFPLRSGRHRVIIAAPERQSSQGQAAAHENANEWSAADGQAHDITLPEIQHILDECTGGQLRAYDPIWMTRFRINQRKVEHYRVGAVMLAGDAAHIHSPLGGQGMNTGMQDALNLGWKLALVCSGRADESLLDSYDEEREPVGRTLLRWTGLLTRLSLNRFPLFAVARNTVAPLVSSRHFIQRLLARSLSETGIHYRHSELVMQGDHWKHGMVVPGDRAPRGADGLSWWSRDKHLLLVFPDTEPLLPRPEDPQQWDEDERTRIPLLNRISDSWRPVLDTVIVLPDLPLMLREPRPSTLLPDPDSTLRRLYGMERGGYVALRPDGYVGFAGGLPDEMELIGWIYRQFRIPSPIQ